MNKRKARKVALATAIAAILAEAGDPGEYTYEEINAHKENPHDHESVNKVSCELYLIAEQLQVKWERFGAV